MKDKLVFDTKEEADRYIKSNPKKLTKKEISLLYNNGKPLCSGDEIREYNKRCSEIRR